jgi:endonuclease/exonuclease/phosphatase family metal-dependent hydrolase
LALVECGESCECFIEGDEIEPWANQGYGVIIAGDFNTKRDQEPMKNLYHSNRILFEGDRTRNRWTQQNRQAPFARRKIDYVFFSDNYFPRSSYYSVLDMKPDYSYHRFYASSSAMR